MVITAVAAAHIEAGTDSPSIARPVSAPLWVRLYVGVVAVTLPIDWFAPSGALLREFGAKPATMVLTLGGLLGLVACPRLKNARRSLELVTLVLFAAWLALGYCAALINFILGWSAWNEAKNPLTQLVYQSLLVAACGIAIVGNSRLARAYPMAALAARYLATAAALHLLIFLLQASGVLSDSHGPLSLFRVTDFTGVHRPTGLFSEPAYFGTFAALYGTALLVSGGGPVRKLLSMVLAAALYAASIAIGAKTFVVVIGAQAAFFIMRRMKSFVRRILSLLMLVLVVLCAIYFIQRYSALNVQANLSSADRLGSTLLALNVAGRGYALPGVGIGQFHFFYKEQYAPDFLRFSKEAVIQLGPAAQNRASTYNLYVRVIVEFGLVGFLLLVGSLWRLWSAELPVELRYVQMLFAGSLGFLLTQDTYFYPPLVFSAALIIAALESRRLGAEPEAA